MINEKEQAVSTEAIGNLSPRQTQELNILGGAIFTELNLDPKNPDDIAALHEVLADCIRRGLHLTGRVWFSPTESIVSTYRAGLSVREKVAEQIKKMASSLLVQYLITNEEAEKLRDIEAIKALALSPKLEDAENLIETLTQRKNDVERFQEELFTNSKLSETATNLKLEARASTLEWSINDRLFANLLAHIALFRTPGLDLEPKDLVTLNELWSNNETRGNSETGVLNAVSEVAKSLGISEESISIYTERMLGIVSNELLNVSDLELLGSTIFIYTQAQIAEEAKEFKTETDKTVRISLKEVTAARNKYPAFLETLKDYLRPIYRQEELPVKYGEMFAEYVQAFTPLEFVFTLKDSLLEGSFTFEGMPTEPAGDLEDLPVETYIEALNLMNSTMVIKETGEEAVEFTDSIKAQMVKFMKERIFREVFRANARWDQILGTLPVDSLVAFLGSVDLNKLNEDQKSAVLNFNLDLWVKLLSETGVEYSVSQSGFKTSMKLKMFTFSPDSAGLIPYLEMLPEEKLTELAGRLRKEIKLD